MIEPVISDWPDLEAYFANVRPILQATATTLVTQTAQKVLAAAQQRAPGKRVAAEIHLDVQGTGFGTKARVYLAGIAIPVAKGAKPHAIVATNAKVLRFVGGSFRGAVAHPGSLPHTFFRDSVSGTVARIDADLRQTGTNAVAQIATGRHP